jgi:hypothetical protein
VQQLLHVHQLLLLRESASTLQEMFAAKIKALAVLKVKALAVKIKALAVLKIKVLAVKVHQLCIKCSRQNSFVKVHQLIRKC